MSSNQLQFQQGMSLREFMGTFGSEEQCQEALRLARWPTGFRCPRCETAGHYVVGQGARRLFQCAVYRHQTSLTAGSLMEHTKLPLSVCFLAIYLIGQAKTGISSLALKRQLGVSYPTAWLLHQKINRAMAARDATHRLEGAVSLDDAYFGGERTGGKAARGSENKVPFVAAVSLSEHGKPLYVKLTLVSGFTLEAIGQWAKRNLVPGARVTSDGLGCFAAVTTAGCPHTPVVVGQRKPKDLPDFKWVNTILGNLKTAFAGTFHALRYSKYGSDYLGAFAYRFNRRFNLRGLITRSVVDVARLAPITRITVKQGHAEVCFYKGGDGLRAAHSGRRTFREAFST